MKIKLKSVIILVVLTLSVDTAEEPKPLHCIRCDQKAQPECLDKPENFKNDTVCAGECFSNIENDQLLRRGCTKDTLLENCDTATCKTCKTEHCNDESYFPAGTRSKCFTCDGKDCFKKSSLQENQAKFCTKNKDSCFTYAFDDQTALRGCLSDQKNEKCKTTVKECVTCTTSKCNENDGEKDLNCYECESTSSTTDNKCKRPDENSSGQTCTIKDGKLNKCSTLLLGREEPKEVCYIKKHGAYIERGCYTSKKPKQEKNTDLVIVGSEQNGICSEDLECHVCSDNGNCAKDDDNSLKEFIKKCDKFTTNCYRYDDATGEGKTVRGCGVPTDANNLRNSSFCYTSKCIAPKLKLQCYNCDSEKDPNCATLKSLDSLKQDDCDGECAIKIKENGHTVRGCKKDILGGEDKKCPENDKLCYTCKGAAFNDQPCNGIIFPDDRRQCYQCGDGKCNDISKETSYPCLVYKTDNKCFMTYDGNSADNILRGCMSDTNISKKCDEQQAKCYKCDNNNCNNKAKMNAATLKCIQCDSNKMDNCPWGFNVNQAEQCKNQVEFWKLESCYTCNQNDNVSRGCVLDATAGSIDNNCTKCQGDACNRQNVNNFTCIRCASDIVGQESCALKAEGIQPIKCINPVSKAEKGCFVDKDATTGAVTRGCLVDFYLPDRQKCLNVNYTACKACFEPNCNNFEFNNGIKNSLSMLLVSIVTLLPIIFIRFN